MKKRTTFIILFLSFCLAIYYLDGNRYVVLKSIELKNDKFVSSLLKADEIGNMIQILDKYGEDYKIEGNIILVKKKLVEDTELIWNYTTKSRKLD